MANPYVEISDLEKFYGSFCALKGVSLTILESELVCFLGPSGCGKTTLLRAIAGLDLPSSGQIRQGGDDITSLPASSRDYGIVFQSYALFPNLTISRNIGFGLENRGLGKSEIQASVNELLELVGLPDQGGKYPSQLSGGQQQRVALARAMAVSPGLLLLDEPLSALDAKVRTHLRHEIKELQRDTGVTTILVTHDQEEALSMADRIVVMNHGVIEQIGTPAEVYREPESLFVADFVGDTNQLAVAAAGADTVSNGFSTFRCRSHGHAAGRDLVAVIRPEDVVPVETGAAPSQDASRIDVMIREMEFLGSFWRCDLDSAALGRAHFYADFSINAVRRLGLTQGANLTVELPADRLMAFEPLQEAAQ